MSAAANSKEEAQLSYDRSPLKHFVPWLICGLGALFYIYEYLLRVAPSVMSLDLMRDFNISAAALGNLAAFFYYIYAPLQLVVGVLMDRYGPRRLFTMACLACTVGTYLFASAHTIFVAEVGRFLVGFGSAFAFVGVLKLATIWLPPERFALIAGITMALGQIGAILGNLVLTELVTAYGWRWTNYLGSIVGVVLTITIFSFICDRGKYQYKFGSNVRKQYLNFDEVFSGLWEITRNPQVWLIGLISCLMYISTSAFAELWGNPYLRQVYHLHPEQAASVISTIFLGWAIGGPMIGWFSDTIRQRRLPMTIGSVVAAVLIAFVIYVPSVPLWALYCSFFIFGFFSSAQVISFALAREVSPERSAGTAVAVTNMFCMAGGVLFQPLIGKVLDLHSSGDILDGIHLYTNNDYQIAFLALPIALFLSVFLTFFLQETNCRLKNVEGEF